MKKPFGSIFALLFFAALFLFGACTARAQHSSSPDAARIFSDAGINLLRQRVSPRDFSLALVSPQAEEQYLTLSELRGAVVLLYFWATWCPSCVAGMPSLESLHRRYQGEGLKVVAVNLQESREHIHAFMDGNGFSFASVLDSDRRVSSLYGIQAIPTSFIIDRDGYIIARLVGNADWDSPQVHAVFESLLR
ncbi:MAG: TlpA family protein disulfide reductase [Treponema sp.]|nr:TlpA family protein disulfide reductase [Treponema sp.]